MNFDDNEEQARFRAEARAWLEQHAKPKQPGSASAYGVMGDATPEAEMEHVRASKAWQRTLYDHGWAGITWPKEAGGRGLGAIEKIIFDQEQSAFDVPQSIFAQGIGMAGPTLIGHGSDAQRERFLGPMLAGDEVWCQLFSEPGAGSDLANLATRAERDGDEYVVNGQKVWTSSAHYADWGILLARTDFDAPKHRGITYFLLDMRTPGIEIRPLRQITGSAHFNEVFLTDVRIPAANVVGAVNDGWRVSMTTLTNERTLIGGNAGGAALIDELVRTARARGVIGDAVVRQRIASVYIRGRIAGFMNWRIVTAVARGDDAGPQSSVLKLAASEALSELGDLGLSILGPQGTLLDYGDPTTGPWQQRFLGQWGSRIGGGTAQVQRNVIGERILGLPREPRSDRDVPFRTSSSHSAREKELS